MALRTPPAHPPPRALTRRAAIASFQADEIRRLFAVLERVVVQRKHFVRRCVGGSVIGLVAYSSQNGQKREDANAKHRTNNAFACHQN